MKNSSTELKVGIFAIVVIIFLTYMTFKVGSLPLIWEKGYRLYVHFSDISGLDEQSRVKIAGVEAGVVENIVLDEGRARVTILINPNIVIHDDATASLRMSGLLGDKYLALTTGSAERPALNSGDTIQYTVDAADIDVLANKLGSAATYLSDLTRNLNDMFGETEKEALKAAIQDLRTVTSNLKDISTANKEPLRRVIAQLDEFTAALSDKGPGFMDDISKIAKHLGEKGPELIDNLNQVARDMREVIGENKDAFKESVENFRSATKSASAVAEKLEKGEGTIGKLMKEDELYDSLNKFSKEAGKSLDVVSRLRTFMDFHTEYNVETEQWKGFFNLTLKPSDDKYYILGVVSDPEGSVETTETTINGVTTTEEEVKTRIEFSAQFVKRFEDFTLRIGLIENTFGFGTDYFFNNDAGRLKIDVWDFSAKEAGSDEAHARIGLDYNIFKFIFVSAGVDNILNSDRRGIYVGGGVKFEDEDFKYLFGTSPGLSLP